MHHDDFKFEPVPGLPEALPEGEHILWQGRPDSLRLAKDAWKLNWVLGYFIVLAVWRVGVSSTAYPLNEAMGHGIPFLIAGLLACGILYTIAVVQARSTIYTLTNKRVAMRIGAALTMTLNLPYVQIRNAELMMHRSGKGTIAFELLGDTRLSYLMTWPHTRPWRFAHTQPALRSIPDAKRVAAIFAETAEARVAEPQITRIAPTADPIAAE
ncbi:photosynthetic complex putative assembly protein PuhB [Marimonas sp. MJW-29]|uniref:Photosynthetic complex putative assembly protein PuhB n=1 Tax=Sulfitobacter sediminis TaxID=3234186 RepID=A0ABV3RRU9_9RHOB